MYEESDGKILTTGCGTQFMVDEKDYERVSKLTWHICQDGYVLNSVNRRGKGLKIRLHRLLLNPSPGKVVDHINGDKLDNRMSNLREATRQENCWNSGPRNTNTSGYKGVSFRKDSGKWKAQINIDGKRVNLGHFDCKHDAARMFNFWAKDTQGEFARLNVIRDGDEI